MTSHLRTRYPALLTMAAVLSPASLSAEGGWGETELSAGLISAYVSEGREDFDGSVTAEGSATVEWELLSVELYHLKALDNDGREWDTTLSLGWVWGGMDWAAGLTHIDYRFAGEVCLDNEFAAEVAWPLSERLVVGLDGVYSIDAEGTHWNLGLAYLVPLNAEFEFEVFGSISYEAGYRSPGYSGIDRATLGAALTVPLRRGLHLNGFIENTFALDGVKHDGGGDQLYGGLSLSYAFEHER